MIKPLKTLILSLLCLGMLSTGSASAADSLAYYSDYFSFVGQDESGYLLFALDNNRSADTDEYLAEHFGVLYDQHLGWVDLVGMGDYPNPLGSLTRIPDSTAFQFSGHPNSGIRIQSRINDLRLEINPLKVQLEETREAREQRWGSSAAVLYWHGRTIPGRVIYAGLSQHSFDRIPHRYSNDWDNFKGFNLALQIGTPANWQDIYLQAEGKKQRLVTRGFVDTGLEQARISAPDLDVTKKGWSLGFYRWEKGWQMHLVPEPSPELPDPLTPQLTLKQVSRHAVSNWVVGGFALSVVEGTLEVEGHASKVLGFAELIK